MRELREGDPGGEAVTLIDIDASQWKTALDFYEPLLAALGDPHWHGRNINALIDSMVYGGINENRAADDNPSRGHREFVQTVRDELTLVILAFGEVHGTIG